MATIGKSPTLFFVTSPRTPWRVVRGRAHHQGVLREVPARGLRQSRDPRPGAGVFRR